MTCEACGASPDEECRRPTGLYCRREQKAAATQQTARRTMPEKRYVTDVPENGRSSLRLYRLCPCGACSGSGKHEDVRCPECRGEGRTLQLLATCDTPADLGLAIFTLGSEGEFDECPMGVMSRPEGEKGTWLVLPWLPSARNVSDAGKVLAAKRWK